MLEINSYNKVLMKQTGKKSNIGNSNFKESREVNLFLMQCIAKSTFAFISWKINGKLFKIILNIVLK